MVNMDIKKGRYWDKAWGLVQGCSPVSPACRSCWCAAEAHMRQHQSNLKIKEQYEGLTVLKDGIPTFTGTVRVREDRLDIPYKTKKSTVWAVWSDLFHKEVDIDFQCLARAVMKHCKWHTFLVLTKRPENLSKFWSSIGYFNKGGSLPNVYFGVTVENQEMADKRIPELVKVPGNKLLSVEPMLGEIVIPKPQLAAIYQVICGGETGKYKRPINIDWVRSLRDQCFDAGVHFFYKSDGKSNRELDGRTHDELIWGWCKCN